jgi:hypothetical protein
MPNTSSPTSATTATSAAQQAGTSSSTLSAARATFIANLAAELTTVLAGSPPVQVVEGPGAGAPLDEAVPSAPLVLVTAPGGLGKSHITCQLLRDRRVVWFGERNALQTQIEKFLSAPLAGVTPLPPRQGAATAAPSLERRPARHDAGFCSQFRQRVEPLRHMGLGRFMKALACRKCPAAPGCAYLEWTPETSWLFAPHARLGLGADDDNLFKGRDIVVIDESPHAQILQAVTLGAHELDAIIAKLRSAKIPKARVRAADALVLVLGTALDLLTNPPPRRSRVELRLLLRDLGVRFINFIPTLKQTLQNAMSADGRVGRAGLQKAADDLDGVVRIDPEALAALMRVSALPRPLAEKMIRLGDALADDVRERPGCVIVLPAPHFNGGIAAGRFVEPKIPSQLPVVVLDATGEPLLYQQMFPDREVRRVNVDVPMAARIVQTVDHRYPASTLSRPNSPAIGRLMDIVDVHKNKNPAHEVAVCIKLGLYKLDHIKERVLRSVDADHVFHPWSNRGDNRFKDADAVFIIGAAEVPPLQLEATARAIMTAVPVSPREQAYEYKVAPASETDAEGWIDFDGTKLPERGYMQGGPNLVSTALLQAELAQAVLRIRPYDPAKPKVIFVLSNIALPQFDTELTDEAELLGRLPPRLVAAREKLLALRSNAPAWAGIDQRRLAAELGITESAMSQLKKKYGETPLWREIEALMQPA